MTNTLLNSLLKLANIYVFCFVNKNHINISMISTKGIMDAGRQLSDGIPWIPLKKFCVGVIGQNAKRAHFFPFSVSALRNNVGGRRSDNFEATVRAHSSF